ncbi:MAG: phospholipase D-like domain-containing protein [Draconibacterium sp.]|nr:phospholipase D-like domain-containing protein [Draconibacterium sp.]
MKLYLILALIFSVTQVKAQNTISNARKKNIGETVTVSGIVTNDNELGKIRYLQDTTAGIAIYDNKTDDTKRGDSITVTGVLDDYNNLLEIIDVSSFTKHSSNHQLPEPKILTIDAIGEEYEGQLVRIDNIEITGSGGTFAGNENYDFTDGTLTGELRINTSTPIVGQSIPSGKFSLIAICSQYSWSNNDTRTGYQLLPRDMDDFITGSTIKFTSAVKVVGQSKKSIRLGWGTDSGSFPHVRYGNSNTINSLTNSKTGNSTTSDDDQWNEVEITGLEPSEIIYAQVFSVNGTDTTFSSIAAYVTESNSSGEINVYFNTEVNETLATQTIAMNIEDAMEDTLASYINRAKESIDFCIYNFNNKTISNALNAAHNRGVKIRFITCESTEHYGVNDLDAEIQVLERPEVSQGGIMHNKFAIFDANSADANKSWIWSGSTNLTANQLYSDANNMIFIQDQSLAKSYEIEFEEMWGGSTNSPTLSNSKFGEEKEDNTPHEFTINGGRIECYFSPSDNTNQKLIDAMETADNNLDVETMLITRSDLAYAISDAQGRGVEVSVITDDERNNSETVNNVLSNSLPADKYIFDDRASGMLHHKFALIDARNTVSNPQVITGSHNWSNSANDRNDENTLIIHDADIANQYFQQFAFRFEQNDGNLVVSAKEIQIADLKVYPNPTEKYIQILANEELQKIELFSIQGILLKQFYPKNIGAIELDLSNENSGIYILRVESVNRKTNTYKIVKR